MFSRKLSEIAEFLGGELSGSVDPVISGAAGLEDACPGELTFVASKGYLEELTLTKASAVIIAPEFQCGLPAIRLANPHEGFARFLELLQKPVRQFFKAGIHETALIHPSADVSQAASIGAYCVIDENSVVGKGTYLGSHVTLGAGSCIGADSLVHDQVSIREGCQIGNRVVLHTGVRIGSDGFGFLPGSEGLQKIPQIGMVVLEDDVEIGSNSCVDRATTGRTVIGRGTKLDNLIQIGHNVRVGSHCVISGQTAIGGSTVIGNGVAIGGGVAIMDHARIGDGARIGGRSGVIKDVQPGATVFGTPALEIKESFRLFSALRRLPDLIRRVRILEKSKQTQENKGDSR